jgi:glycosyltransferase involved in cell wall biosynthesis
VGDPGRWSLVVPMWNEAARIEATVATLAGAFGERGVEILFVDDGSDDGTADVAEREAKECGLEATIVRLPRNRGKGAAVRAGLLQAGGAVAGFVDADLSAAPAEIERVFAAVETEGVDVVLASRAVAAATITVQQPFGRRWSGWFFNLGLRAAGLTSRSDTQCGLKAFRSAVVPDLFEPMVATGFAFDVEVLARAERLRLAITEVPIEWHHVDGSRLSPARDGWATVREAWKVRRVLRDEGRPAATLPR